MQPLDEQQQEYREIKAWLAGEKPPARGRTWRRKIRESLPIPVRHALITVAPSALSLLLRAGIGLLMAESAPLLLALFAGDVPSDTGLPLPLDELSQGLKAGFIALQSILRVLCLAIMAVAGLAWALGHED